jgi:membrane-bound ClpP family serine protease
MKSTPLTIGIILLVVGLIGLVFSQFSVFWMWVLVILGIAVIIWTGMAKKEDKTIEKK